jgi:hypothetical protein
MFRCAFTPHVRSWPGVVPQRFERDGELRLPSALGGLRADSPVGVPVQVEAAAVALSRLAFASDLRVELDAERVGAEDECVLTIVERVEQDLNRIGVVEVGVAAALAHDDLVGFRVEADDADVEILAIDQKPDFGALAGGLPLFRPLLDESAEGIRVRPARFIDAPVDDRVLALAKLIHHQLRSGGGLRGGRRSISAT